MTDTDRPSPTSMFSRPYFWVLFTLISAVCIVFAVRYFSRAFPVVNIDLKMDRSAALTEARRISEQHRWGPSNYREAAAFNQDDRFQTYVELAAGGNEEYARIIKSGVYSPYIWEIRHFKPGEIFETSIAFTPSGKPYGFSLDIPEQQPGPTLPPAAARTIAERQAAAEWQIDFSSYQIVESSQKRQPSGRTDHVFVYERADEKIIDARYRLQLVVSGDIFSELSHYVKIPESFTRRYQEMRSANDTIAAVATIAAGVLYVLGGCIIALFMLTRKRWTLVFPAVQVALVIAFFQVLSDINALPLGWMGYDTAISFSAYVLNQVLSILVKFLADGALLAISFIAAESLTRRTFPDHPLLWRVWEPGAAASKQILGRTLAGYLLVGIFCAYQVGLYFITTKTFGWWTPSDALISPDLFATYLPWFTPFAQSAHAGVWEESLFRAVPIALAALIGQKLGKRNLFIVIGLIVQALVFAAAHANYPGEPSYARLVELIIPSLGFGLLYIFLGLLPGIVLHFAFDSVLMSIPIMISSAPGVWFSKVAIVALTFIPLAVVLYSRLKAGKWTELSDEYYNRSWNPPAQAEAPAAPVVEEEGKALPRKTAYIIYALGLAGIIAWFFAAPLKSLVPGLSITRINAVAAAKAAWRERGIMLELPWKGFATAQGKPGLEDDFVWRTGGKAAYIELMTKGYLQPPVWEVRFARFAGDLTAKAEEFGAVIANKGSVVSLKHDIPESRSGSDLNEEDARALALRAIEQKYSIKRSSLEEISANSNKLPERRNWQFVFSQPGDYPLKEGQARILVSIDGNEITGINKYVFVPEQWIRKERNYRSLQRLITTIGSIALAVLYAAGIGAALAAWIRKRFDMKTFLGFTVVLFALNLLVILNHLPQLIARLSTAEPVMNQLLTFAGFSLLGALLISLSIGVMNGFIQAWRRESSNAAAIDPVAGGLAAGALLAGVLSLTAALVPSRSPQWPVVSEAGSFVPALGVGLSVLVDYIRQTTVYLLIFLGADIITARWTKMKGLVYSLFLVVGFGIASGRFDDSLILWAVSGVIIGNALFLGYRFLFKYRLSMVPFAVAGITLLGLMRQTMYNSFPGMLYGGLAAMILVLTASYYWSLRIERR